MKLAPVVLFAYNRPQLLRKTLESLAANELAQETELYVYADGPKENADAHALENIRKVRALVREKNWCGKVTLIESEKNKGLATSIIEGVTQIVNAHSKIIVVEDDVLLSRYFLRFMNDALEQHKDDANVQSIGSWNYFCDPALLKDNFFYRFPDSIAWATFDRAWKLFEKDSDRAMKRIAESGRAARFDGELNYPYFSNMLKLQAEGKISSWAIRWTATGIIHNMLSFFPRQTLSVHIGFGDDATHERMEDYNTGLVLATAPQEVKRIPVEENVTAIAQWRKFVREHFVPKTTAWMRFKKAVRFFIPKR
jgi:GR25 family glycosyltransferase involved in LPS biosynthesis